MSVPDLTSPVWIHCRWFSLGFQSVALDPGRRAYELIPEKRLAFDAVPSLDYNLKDHVRGWLPLAISHAFFGPGDVCGRTILPECTIGSQPHAIYPLSPRLFAESDVAFLMGTGMLLERVGRPLRQSENASVSMRTTPKLSITILLNDDIGDPLSRLEHPLNLRDNCHGNAGNLRPAHYFISCPSLIRRLEVAIVDAELG